MSQTERHDDDARDVELDAILGAYFAECEADPGLDRDAWIARYPDFAAELWHYFEEQDRLDRIATPFRTYGAWTVPETTHSSAPGDPGPGNRPASPSNPLRDFEILGVIARGGMGVIYRARQLSLKRDVALKRIARPGDSEGLRRFRNEAEAAASLDHPHIVPVYEYGTHDGIPYLCMKLIDGVDLGRHLAHHPTDARRAAGLVATIARAVHHAHQRGVLHRDLKPSNILIDAEGEPHVADFGLAAWIESEGVGAADLTRSGALLGTPRYMAPEQARGGRRSITVATDVHGLGTILYFLLTGQPPFGGDSVHDTIEQVLHRSPDPPSRRGVGLRVPADLETICLKCLEKEPERRYTSAEALANDLDRWIVGEPIAARAVGRLERWGLWCRRNPLVASLAGSILTLLTLLGVGLLVATILLARERNEARANFAAARSAVDEYLTRVAGERRLSAPGLQPLRRSLLDSALRYYETFARQHADDPRLTAYCASAWLRVGRINEQINSPTQARPAYEKALEHYRRLHRNAPSDQEMVEGLGASLVSVGAARAAGGESAGCLDLYDEAIRLLSGLDQPVEKAREALARAYHEKGALLDHLGKPNAAQSAYREAIAIREALVAEHADDVDLTMTLARSLMLLAWNLADHRGDPWPFYERANTLLLDLSSRHPEDPEIANALAGSFTNLANYHFQAGRLRAAEPHYREALDRMRQVVRANPEVDRFRVNLAVDESNMGDLLWTLGDLEGARTCYRKGLEMADALIRTAPGEVTYQDKRFRIVADWGKLEHEHEKGQPSEARKYLEDALKSARHLAEVDSSRRHDTYLAEALINLAWTDQREGKLGLAADQAREALAWLDKRPGSPGDPAATVRAEVLLLQASLARARGDRAEAVAAAERSVRASQELASPGPDDAAAQINLARAQLEQGETLQTTGDDAGARKVAGQALAILEAQRVRSPEYAQIIRLIRRARQLLPEKP